LASIGQTVTVKIGSFEQDDRYGERRTAKIGRGCVKTLGTFAN
jgi:hypothetical protein